MEETMLTSFSWETWHLLFSSGSHFLTFFLSTSRMAWLTSLRRAGFLKASSLQDLMTWFIVSRMPITTCRSCSVCTVSRKQGSTTSSNFSRAAGETHFYLFVNDLGCSREQRCTFSGFPLNMISSRARGREALPRWLASLGFSFHTLCWARQNWPMAPNAARRTSSWGNWRWRERTKKKVKLQHSGYCCIM